MSPRLAIVLGAVAAADPGPPTSTPAAEPSTPVSIDQGWYGPIEDLEHLLLG